MKHHLIAYLEKAALQNKPDAGLRFLDRRENAEWYDWQTIYTRALKAAGALHAAGVKSGDRVAIILPTCIGFIDTFLGCQVLGAIPVPMYPPVRLGRLDEYFERSAAMLDAVKAVAVVSNSQVNRVLGKLLPLYPLRLGFIDAEKLPKGSPCKPVDISSDQLALVQFSSGTTVAPKAVALTHRQILSNAICIQQQIEANSQGITPSGVSWLPLYHDMGLIGCILPAILVPGALTLIPPEVFLAKPAIWLRAIAKYRATSSTAPNFAYALCNERIDAKELENCDLSCWKMALCGAEPVSPETLREFARKFSQWNFSENSLAPVYGLSEASLAVTFSPFGSGMKTFNIDRQQLAQGKAVKSTDEHAWELVSVGAPLPGFAVEIRDEHGLSLPENTEGIIYVSGPSLCQGYFDHDESPIENGWLNTGDVGFLHQGELYITGRKKDVIILHGQNHMPHEIERALDKVHGIRTGCAAAVSDIGPEGERLIVFAEYREVRDSMAELCRQAIVAATGVDPALVVLLEPGTIPRTSSGKIRRAETLKLWKKNQLTAPDKVTPWLLAGAMAASYKERILQKLKLPEVF